MYCYSYRHEALRPGLKNKINTHIFVDYERDNGIQFAVCDAAVASSCLLYVCIAWQCVLGRMCFDCFFFILYSFQCLFLYTSIKLKRPDNMRRNVKSIIDPSDNENVIGPPLEMFTMLPFFFHLIFFLLVCVCVRSNCVNRRIKFVFRSWMCLYNAME